MKFETGVITLILIAGLFTVTPYGLYGGSIKPLPGIGQETVGRLGDSSFVGSAAGGRQSSESRAPDCRSCAQKGRP